MIGYVTDVDDDQPFKKTANYHSSVLHRLIDYLLVPKLGVRELYIHYLIGSGRMHRFTFHSTSKFIYL